MDKCDFCGRHPDRPLSLFFNCEISRKFWAEIANFFIGLNINIPLSRLSILFGITNESASSTVNTLILIGKQVIWTCKHKQIIPNFELYKRYVKDYLLLVKYCEEIRCTKYQFSNQWGKVLQSLENV